MLTTSITARVLTSLLLVTGPAAEQEWGPSTLMGGHSLITDFSKAKTLPCPSGKHAIGLIAHSGTYIHGLELQCATLGRYGEHSNVTTVDGIIGGRWGAAKNLRCPDREVLVGFEGRSGLWVDRGSVTSTTSAAGCTTRTRPTRRTAWCGG